MSYSTPARCATARCGPDRPRRWRRWQRRPSTAPRSAHRILRAGRRAPPARADRHGLGGRAPARCRHVRGRRVGRPCVGHHDPRPAGGGHRGGAQPDVGALRGQSPHGRGRRGGSDRPDDRDRRPGRQLRPGPQRGARDALQGGRPFRHADRGGPAARRKGGRVGRRRRHRPGGRGRRPHRQRADHPPVAPGRRRGRRPRPCPRGRRLFQRPRPGRRPVLRRGRRGHGHPVPALSREPRARRREGAVPGHARHRHHRHDQGRRRTPARRAHRPGRPS